MSWIQSVAALLMLSSVPAMAHETGEHEKVTGTVRSIRPDNIVVETRDGDERTILLDKDTECGDDVPSATCSAIRKGDRVVVTTTGKGGQLTADEIRFSSRKRTGEEPAEKPDHRRPHSEHRE